MSVASGPSRVAAFGAATGWFVTAGAVVGIFAFDHGLRGAGRADLATFTSTEQYVFVIAVTSAATVGAALAARRPRHPVGWLFLGLGFAIALSGLADSYAAYGVLARPGSLPAADAVAVFGRASFVPWLVLLALILMLTPTGRVPSERWRSVVALPIVSGGVLLVASLVSTRPLDSPFQSVHNPMAIPAISSGVNVVAVLADLGAVGSVVVAAIALIGRYRSATGVERLQLRWITLAAVPIPLLVVATWIASATGHPFVLTLLGGALVAVLPVGAAAAITQYHLYDIDRLLGRALSYLLLSTVVVVSYAVVVVAVGGSFGSGTGRSQFSAVVATLAAISVALPVRRRLQTVLDQRFNRRQFDAVQTIRRYVRDPEPATTLEQILQHALNDPTLKVAYWIADRSCWVTHNGYPAPADRDGYEVRRRNVPLAWISYDPQRVEHRVVDAVMADAYPELENERLRAAIELQLVEVRDSRERIVAAQHAERHRIERNLHDGAQQRLLALAFQLRAAEVSGNGDRMRTALDGAVDELQRAVADLRALANGLHPALLSDGGLAAAFEDLAERCPITVRLTATDERFSAKTEETAWFIACETIANAVKHSEAQTIHLDVRRHNGHLVLCIEDDGNGRADPAGQGLRGIADRADALRGHLSVSSRPGTGTAVRAELPCES